LTNEKAGLNLQQDKLDAEVGPIKYVAELIYGENAEDNFDNAVRMVILVLIFVFDPLAVLLLIAANISLRQWRDKKQHTQRKQKEWLVGKVNKQHAKLLKLGRKQRNYKKLMAKMGDFKGMSPDEIKVKLDQIYDWNDKK
jgi:Mg2+/Co2+ transporter CorB